MLLKYIVKDVRKKVEQSIQLGQQKNPLNLLNDNSTVFYKRKQNT